ncbi:beta-ketoacyl synthase N-terminal-like domain-containing protein [Streptomyces sp. XD-27]|uniref:beta-ketoacyl synthase N-terminal-like domain-containing protein n=1 Tax=Streptomyces sp. XD-27 TaxID=3062779 RepID=UPI0026F4201C|nr:beta-ketoacyl synthase N-terminal-like domain-containing protein [Streptomyces sp. XD-27]WKX70529.1 beta-ketoacyl synthase N-terminal-like domain-containing protein [Streptomyces sp. XD-27]
MSAAGAAVGSAEATAVRSAPEIVVTGVGLALPGAAHPAELLRATPVGTDTYDTTAVIGRRGHRYKDRATRLALCAAVGGLRDAGLIPADGEELAVPGGTVGVVASSNLGNLDTVCRTAAAIGEQGVTAISPMDLPNASGNVVASTVAIRFGLRGPNTLLCNGPASGLDAVHWGANLVAAGRIRHALVIGVETRNDIVQELTGHGADELLDGAVALVLESAGAARERGAVPAAVLGAYERRAGLRACVDALLAEGGGGGESPGIWFTPERYESAGGGRVGGGDRVSGGGPAPGVGPAPGDGPVPETGRATGPAPVPDTVPRHDVSRAFGRSSGALGVLQCAAATAWMTAAEARGARGRALITAGDDAADGVAGLWLHPYGAS